MVFPFGRLKHRVVVVLSVWEVPGISWRGSLTGLRLIGFRAEVSFGGVVDFRRMVKRSVAKGAVSQADAVGAK